MNVRNELKSIISKQGKTFKKVCEAVADKTNNPKFNSNNLSTKI